MFLDAQSVTEYYIVLQSITEYYRVLQSITENYKYYKVLQSITKYYKVFQSITKYYKDKDKSSASTLDLLVQTNGCPNFIQETRTPGSPPLYRTKF